MPNPLSTSNSEGPWSRALRSGLLWTIVAFVAIECTLDQPLSRRFFSHEVDQVVFDVENQHYSPQVLVLGDSVGRQVGYAASRLDTNILSMATNGGLEMAGHFFILRRYLERNPPPPFVVFLMRDPLAGKLRSIYTENYLQRCFGRPEEIASMALQRRSLLFAVTGLAYRSPTFRYRLHLQKMLSPIPGGTLVEGFRVEQTTRRTQALSTRSPLARFIDWAFPPPYETISFHYMHEALRLAGERGIRCLYIPTPLSEAKYEEKTTSKNYARLKTALKEFKTAYPSFDYTLEIIQRPADHFTDETHLKRDRVAPCAEDFLVKLRRFTNP